MKRRAVTFVGIVTATLVVFAGAAFASEVVDDVVDGDGTSMRSPEIVTQWDDDAGAVVISIGTTEDDGDPCEGVMLERVDGELVITVDTAEATDPDEGSWFAADGEEGPVADDGEDVELPPGCYVFDGTAEDGKVTHGTMVSAVARELSPHDLDVPKGWIMRMVAKEKPTKVKASDSEDRDADENDPNAVEEPEDGATGQAKGQDKAAKADDKAAKAEAKSEKKAAHAEEKAAKANDKAKGRADKGAHGG